MQAVGQWRAGVKGHAVKGGGGTGSGALRQARGRVGDGVGSSTWPLRQRKAAKLLEQRRESHGDGDGDGRQAQSGGLSVWGAAEMAAVYQASRDGDQACIGRSLGARARRTTDGSRSTQTRKNIERESAGSGSG